MCLVTLDVDKDGHLKVMCTEYKECGDITCPGETGTCLGKQNALEDVHKLHSKSVVHRGIIFTVFNLPYCRDSV